MLNKIMVESEGMVNGFFTLVFSDGVIRSGWSCDQGEIEMDDEQPLDEEIHPLCMDLWFSMDEDKHDDENRRCAEFVLHDGEWKKTKEYNQVS